MRFCAGISPPTIVLKSCSNPQKIQQVFTSATKKNLGFELQVFCEWCHNHKWSCFRPFWSTWSGPRPKPL